MNLIECNLSGSICRLKLRYERVSKISPVSGGKQGESERRR